MSLPIVHPGYAQLALAAFVAGMMNAICGGGSFFSFPALLGQGVPPVNANASNTVALWPGLITSLIAFRRDLGVHKRLAVIATVCAVSGGLAGALLLLFTSQQEFMHMVPWLLLFGTVLFALSGQARRLLRPALTAREKQIGPALIFSLLVASVYIGYFGAGAGFLLLAILTVVGGLKQLGEISAVRVLAVTIGNLVAVVTFIFAGAVYWKQCLLMLAFAAAGGYFGAHYSRKINQRYLRLFIIMFGLALAAYYFVKIYL